MSETLNQARDILDTMLGFLGFVVHIEDDSTADGPGLQVFTEEAELLIGRRGERVDDIQYLVNRLLRIRDRASPRVRIDVEHHGRVATSVPMDRVVGWFSSLHGIDVPLTGEMAARREALESALSRRASAHGFAPSSVVRFNYHGVVDIQQRFPGQRQ